MKEWDSVPTKVFDIDDTSYMGFGRSISLSADGCILAVGSPGGDNDQVSLYQCNSMNEWDSVPTKVFDIDGDSNSDFGNSISLSADGCTLAVSSLGSNNGQVLLYQCNSMNEWDSVPTKVFDIDGDINSNLISLLADGCILAISSPEANSGNGQVLLYQCNSMNEWDSTPIKVFDIDGDSYSDFGASVSLSADGCTLAIGAPSANSYVGQVSLYQCNSMNEWDSVPTKVFDIDGDGNYIGNGYLTSLSGDGYTLVISARSNDYTINELYIYSKNWV